MRKKLFFLLGLSLFITVSTSKASSITGKVTDAETGEELVGVSVYVKDFPRLGAATGLDGTFIIRGISSNTATLQFRYIGYDELEQTFDVNSHSANEISIKLFPAGLYLEGIEVVANSRSNEYSARSTEKLSTNILNVVSGRAIDVSPDITVANVIQRVSGVTVERNNSGDGQYAILRGMDKRYNYTLVNGIKIPSPDNKNRFVPLDIFPAELLDRLEVTKALTANMEGDAIGGAVNMVMKDAPSQMQLTANLSGGYNASYFDKDFQYFKTGGIDRKSPFERYGEGYPAKVSDFTRENMVIHSRNIVPNIFSGISYGNRFIDQKLGVMLAVTYQNSFRGNNSLYYSNDIASDVSNLPVLTSKNDRFYYEQQQRYGIHTKLDYALATGHKLQWYNAYMDFTTKQIRDITSTSFTIGYDPVAGNYNLSYDSRLRMNHQNIINSTLKGEHFFSEKKKFGVDWSAVFSKAFNETPDNLYIYLSSRANNFEPNPPSVTSSSGSGGVKRRWEHNSDQDIAGYLNFTYKLDFSGVKSVLSAGGMYRDKARTSFFNEYTFMPYDPDKAEGKNNLIKGVDWNTFDEIKLRIHNPHGTTGDPLNYDASEKISAGYIQAKANIGNLEVNTGLRVENTRQGYTLKHPQAGVKSDSIQQYTDLLPSIHLKYAFTDDVAVKTSYYKSINRPSFYEIVPFRVVNEDYNERGNPELKRAVAHNFDVRFEYFPKMSEQFMLGLFYKEIQNPIEVGIFTGGQGTYYMPQNFGTAHNYGLEIDITKYFRWFGVKTNYTFTKSQITTNKATYIDNPNYPAEPDRIKQIAVDQTRPLNNQAAHVANLSLLVKTDGWDGQIAFAYTGDRLQTISRFYENDIWQAGFLQTDISVEKGFENGITIFGKASNLLNTPMILYIPKYNESNENVIGYQSYKGGTMIRKDFYGQTFQVGVKYRF
ncbi:MAG: TonB-dependent receptor [Porphyromonadaceae bacterium]|jgi:TonB-dependent receptor|nr:TonB-dependent receptor [Porphyromonadaceae bacterium]